MVELAEAITAQMQSNTSDGRASPVVAREAIAITTPENPSSMPSNFRFVSGSPSNFGAAKASNNGLVLAMIAPIPEERCRSARYVNPR
jgi:hypothetical protein